MWSCLSVAGQGLLGVERFVVNLFTVEGDVVLTLCLPVWCDRIRARMGENRRRHMLSGQAVAKVTCSALC